jgi:uncharacterized protein
LDTGRVRRAGTPGTTSAFAAQHRGCASRGSRQLTLYIDSSAFLKRYVAEPDSSQAESYLLADAVWVTANHTQIEVRRNLARLLDGADLDRARRGFASDWNACHVVALDDTTCKLATEISEATGARTLDALHLAAAVRAGTVGLTFLTYDIRQAQAARAMGIVVAGS